MKRQLEEVIGTYARIKVIIIVYEPKDYEIKYVVSIGRSFDPIC